MPTVQVCGDPRSQREHTCPRPGPESKNLHNVQQKKVLNDQNAVIIAAVLSGTTQATASCKATAGSLCLVLPAHGRSPGWGCITARPAKSTAVREEARVGEASRGQCVWTMPPGRLEGQQGPRGSDPA